MLKFTEDDFTWADGDLMVSEASSLGLPPGPAPREFTIEGRGIFVLTKTQQSGADIAWWRYTNIAGITAQVFND